jgi:hypothetical protein
MLHLYENGVEVLRKKANNNKLDIYWNNYNLVVWNKNNGGFFSTEGAYRNNSWGIKKEFLVNEKGTWALPGKYVKYFK